MRTMVHNTKMKEQKETEIKACEQHLKVSRKTKVRNLDIQK